MWIFEVNGFEITIELIIRYLAKNTIDFEPFIKSTIRHFARSKFLVDSNEPLSSSIAATQQHVDEIGHVLDGHFVVA